MKYFLFVFSICLTTSCQPNNEKTDFIVENYPYLLGKWSGEGRFLDVDLHEKVGSVNLTVEIKEKDIITGSLGEANLKNTTINNAKYGFEIRGILDNKVESKMTLSKDHLIILFVLPKENRENVKLSDANFHLKTNYIFDFGMRVGGVILNKE